MNTITYTGASTEAAQDIEAGVAALTSTGANFEARLVITIENTTDSTEFPKLAVAMTGDTGVDGVTVNLDKTLLTAKGEKATITVTFAGLTSATASIEFNALQVTLTSQAA